MSKIDPNKVVIWEKNVSNVKNSDNINTNVTESNPIKDTSNASSDKYTGKANPSKHPDEVSKVDFSNINGSIVKASGATSATVNSIKNLKGIDKAWVGNISSNTNSSGKSETAILTPKGLDYSKEIKVVYYFHGHHGSNSSSINSINDDLMKYAKEHNAIIVIPQGPNEDNGKRTTDSWLKPPKGDFSKFNQDVLVNIKNILPPSQNGAQPKITSIELAGHSAGGVAVRNCLEGIKDNKNSFSGSGWNDIKITNVHFLDASYEDGNGSGTSNRAEETYAAINKMDNKPKFHIMVATNGDREYKFGAKEGSHFKDKDKLKAKGVELEDISGKTKNHNFVPNVFFSGK